MRTFEEYYQIRFEGYIQFIEPQQKEAMKNGWLDVYLGHRSEILSTHRDSGIRRFYSMGRHAYISEETGMA